MVSWTDDPFARCIARAPIGDQRETVLREIKRPLGNRVFFAGEHTDERPGPGGMDGAIRSGLRVVNEVTGAPPGQAAWTMRFARALGASTKSRRAARSVVVFSSSVVSTFDEASAERSPNLPRHISPEKIANLTVQERQLLEWDTWQ